MSTGRGHVVALDHTGFTVTDLEHSLVFWRDVLGFELSHRAHQGGAMAEQITGVPGAEISLAVLRGPGHKIELLQYHGPPDRVKAAARPCDSGFIHLALTVEHLEVLLTRMSDFGWTAAGEPQLLTAGPNAGKRVVYVRDGNGATIELMELPKP